MTRLREAVARAGMPGVSADRLPKLTAVKDLIDVATCAAHQIARSGRAQSSSPAAETRTFVVDRRPCIRLWSTHRLMRRHRMLRVFGNPLRSIACLFVLIAAGFSG